MECDKCGCPMIYGYGKKLNVCIGGAYEPEEPEYEETLGCPKCEAYKSYQKDILAVITLGKEYTSEDIVDLVIEKYPGQGLYVFLIIRAILNSYKTGRLLRREHPFLKHTYLYSLPDKLKLTDDAIDRELAEILF
jgi:hypothetical protein